MTRMRRGVTVLGSWTSPTTSSTSARSAAAKRKKRNSMTRPTCEIRRCRRPSFHLTLKGRLGSHDIAQMCTFHWNLLSFLTAPGRLTISGVHRLKTIRVGQLHVFAAYRRGTIYVTEHFANCTPEQMVYTL